jgi:alkylation response protein AidB-like acyl-CoA dehydrogenase
VTPNLLDTARELRTAIDANAAKAGGSPVPPDSVHAMRQAGLFSAMTPRELGGAELTLLEAMETGRLDLELNNAVRQATVHVTQEGADIVRQAYLLAGTTALRDGPLQRCFRDIHAGSQHFFASPASTLDYARDLVSASPDSALDS